MSATAFQRMRREAVGAKPSPITREDIAKMPKADVVGYLELHGVPDASGKVDDLRAALIKVMFVDG